MNYRLTATLAGLLMSAGVSAGPMGFKDTFMSMADFGPNWRELYSTYAFTARDAVGVSALYMKSDDGSKQRDFAEATYTRLLARWNAPHSQTNVWLLTGIGAVRGNDFSGSRTMLAPGLQVDHETTRLYLSAFARAYRAPGIRHDFVSARAGFSFYETDYDETQPWLVVEARRMRNLSDRTEITPMLRLINRSFFVEVGANTQKQWRFNLMYIF
ncbi:MAG: hypothetical protein RLZZ502_1032 [Pseudomonadota bacterium]